ncbi:hypothetical protein [Streptomyces coeruleorubidus]|uniref:hypothetical protein n=1 Tax=Streptomyces coeruleorubidus TaxID=116188 RepID=UPI0033F9A34F
MAAKLAPGDTGGAADVHVKDARTGALRRVSDVPGDQEFGAPSISADGTLVGFAAPAPRRLAAPPHRPTVARRLAVHLEVPCADRPSRGTPGAPRAE